MNKQIFETIYYGALEASCDLAKEHGPYETYEGSPVSKGVSIWINFFFFFLFCGPPSLSTTGHGLCVCPILHWKSPLSAQPCACSPLSTYCLPSLVLLAIRSRPATLGAVGTSWPRLQPGMVCKCVVCECMARICWLGWIKLCFAYELLQLAEW